MRLVRLVAVRVRLVRPVDRDVDVVALLLAQHRELGAHGREEQDITNDGWPVAQPRFSRRPDASTITPWPSGKMKRSTCGLMLSILMPLKVSRPAMSISLSKWPMLPTIALFFIFSMCFTMMMSLLPVAVMKMSISPTTSSIVVTS